MNDNHDAEPIVAVVRRGGRYSWYEADRELWVLDWDKWRQFWVDAGYEVPRMDESERFGIRVVNQATGPAFLDKMHTYEVPKQELHARLAERIQTARSWWDVRDCFPMIFVDFDLNRVAAFYPEGTRMERYIPDGWKGEFVDFSDEIPDSEKYWLADGRDMLKEINERGRKI